MSIVQWLLLVLVIVVVVGVYWYMRRQASDDPWQGMDEPPQVGDQTRDQAGNQAGKDPTAAGGDSYVVRVRTLNKETPADRKAALEAARARESEQPDDDPSADRTRVVRQPTAVRRQPRAAVDSMSSSNTTVRSSEAETPRGLDPQLDSQAGSAADSTSPADDATEISSAATERVEMQAPEPSRDSQIFVLYVAAPEGRAFDGPVIHEALASADLKFGLNDMYHRVTEVHGVTESVFCVANMLNPGTLDPIDQDQLSTRGLALFLLVPGALGGRSAMRDMMETANLLATELGGHVLDDNRARLKTQTAQYMMDQIADVDRRAQLARRR